MADFKIGYADPEDTCQDQYTQFSALKVNFKGYFFPCNPNCGYPSANTSTKKGRPSLRSGLNNATNLGRYFEVR